MAQARKAAALKPQTRAKTSPKLTLKDPTKTLAISPARAPKRNIRFWLTTGLILLIAALLGTLFPRLKGSFIVATVNGKPIFKWQLTKRLTDRFGGQMLEALVGEQLILAEAQKQNVLVNQEEINQKIAEIESDFGGATGLKESLKVQGVSQDEFENQIRIQLLIDKMLSKDVSVSAEEIDDYVKNNSANISATTDAEHRTQAESQIRDRKLSNIFLDWFNSLKQNAKIERFL